MKNDRIDSAKKSATQQIALLVCAARTALGLECTTDHIREVAEEYQRLDEANFARAVGSARGLTVKGQRGTRRRVVRMTIPGKESTAELVRHVSDIQ